MVVKQLKHLFLTSTPLIAVGLALFGFGLFALAAFYERDWAKGGLAVFFIVAAIAFIYINRKRFP